METYNYVVKSILAIKKIKNIDYKIVEKASSLKANHALLNYNEHLAKGYKPIILKKVKKEWVEINLENLIKEIKPIKKRNDSMKDILFILGILIFVYLIGDD